MNYPDNRIHAFYKTYWLNWSAKNRCPWFKSCFGTKLVCVAHCAVLPLRLRRHHHLPKVVSICFLGTNLWKSGAKLRREETKELIFLYDFNDSLTLSQITTTFLPQNNNFKQRKFINLGEESNHVIWLLGRDIHIECSKQFKWNSYFYVSGQSRPFWAALKLL